MRIHHDTVVSISSLQENLEKAGLTQKLLHKIAIERDEELRARFRADIWDLRNFSGTGMEFVTVDESSKDEHTYARRYGHTPIGCTPDFSDVFVRGEQYSLVAAMSIEGYLATHVKEGSFDMATFFSFIIDDLVCPSFSFVQRWIYLEGPSHELLSWKTQCIGSWQLLYSPYRSPPRGFGGAGWVCRTELSLWSWIICHRHHAALFAAIFSWPQPDRRILQHMYVLIVICISFAHGLT